MTMHLQPGIGWLGFLLSLEKWNFNWEVFSYICTVYVDRIYTGVAKQFIRHIKTSQPTGKIHNSSICARALTTAVYLATDRLRTEMIRVTLLKVRNLVLVAVQSIVLFNQPSVTLFLYTVFVHYLLGDWKSNAERRIARDLFWLYR
jgi:hypothetical protein